MSTALHITTQPRSLEEHGTAHYYTTPIYRRARLSLTPLSHSSHTLSLLSLSLTPLSLITLLSLSLISLSHSHSSVSHPSLSPLSLTPLSLTLSHSCDTFSRCQSLSLLCRRFQMKCHLFVNYIEMQTDPASCDYVIVSGAQRKEERCDMKDNEQILTTGTALTPPTHTHTHTEEQRADTDHRYSTDPSDHTHTQRNNEQILTTGTALTPPTRHTHTHTHKGTTSRY